MRKRKQSLILVILCIVLALGIGYAYLNTTLNISGTTDVDANTWNVYWDNVVVTSGSVPAESPTIDTNKTTVSFNVTLSKPGDFYEFTVDAKNDGTIDAMIDTITKTINNSTTVPTYLKYEVAYSDGIEISNNQLLETNTTETYKVRVYKTDISPSDLPNDAHTLSIIFGTDYIQKDDNAIPVRTIIYSVSKTHFTIGSTIPTGISTYDNYQDAVTAFGQPFFIKHIVVNNKIKESYLGFILNDTVYYLRGGVDESNLSTKPIYESNKELLKNLFGEENCVENTRYYNCYNEVANIYPSVFINGGVHIHNIGMGCSGGVTSYCDRE